MHAASGLTPSSVTLSSCQNLIIYIYSACGSCMSAVTSWLWLSSVRSSNVQQTWIWDRKYDSCMPSFSIRMSCVRPFSSVFLSCLSDSFFSFFPFLTYFYTLSPILLWIYGRRIRMSSKYAHKPVHHPTEIKVVESESQPQT